MTYPAPEKPTRDEWFNEHHLPELGDPHDLDLAPSEYEPPIDDWVVEEPLTMHEKMYRLATQNHSPWKGGGSENFQGGSEQIWDDYNDPYGGH